MINSSTATPIPVTPTKVSPAPVVPSFNGLSTLADLSGAGLLRPTQVRALTEVVRIALNITDDAADIPLESLREIAPATLSRAIRLGPGSVEILNSIAADIGWAIGDRALS